MSSWFDPFDGWDIPTINQAAVYAMSRCHCDPRQFVGDPRESAWEGVALAIAADPACSWSTAVTEGARVLSRDIFHQRNNNRSAGPRFHTFWNDTLRDSMRHTQPDTFLAKLAVGQVMNALPPKHQVTLVTFAAIGSVAGCAEAWQVTTPAASARIKAARVAALALWFDGETPPLPRRLHGGSPRVLTNREKCARGHDWLLHGKTRRQRNRLRRVCGECERLDAARRRATA